VSLGQDQHLAACPRARGAVQWPGGNPWSFRYHTSLPSDVDADNVEASMDQGVLTLRIPKAREGQGRRIEVTGGQSEGRQSQGARSQDARSQGKRSQGARSS
jgi:HSP20 family protein